MRYVLTPFQVHPNALPCALGWRGGAPREGSEGQPGTGASGVPSGAERGRPCPTRGPR
jgi:hypothetical protein